MAAPSTPYSITALVRCRYTLLNVNTQNCGVCFRESGTGKLYVWYVSSGGQLQAIKWTNPTTFSAVGVVNIQAAAQGQFIWLRLTDDGANLLFLMSMDGVNFHQYGSEGRTVFMAGGPDQVGIHANDASANLGTSISVFSWVTS